MSQSHFTFIFCKKRTETNHLIKGVDTPFCLKLMFCNKTEQGREFRLQHVFCVWEENSSPFSFFHFLISFCSQQTIICSMNKKVKRWKKKRKWMWINSSNVFLIYNLLFFPSLFLFFWCLSFICFCPTTLNQSHLMTYIQIFTHFCSTLSSCSLSLSASLSLQTSMSSLETVLKSHLLSLLTKSLCYCC